MMWVMVHGFSRHHSMESLAETLSGHPSLAMMMFASGNYVYIHAAVRDANEMANVVSFLQREGLISDIQVGIIPVEGTPSDHRLDRMDMRIIETLSEDARLNVSQLADSLGSSPKTVRRRLKRLIDEDLAHFSIQWWPDGIGDVVCNIHLLIREDAPSQEVLFSLLRNRGDCINRIYSFSNLPNHLIVTLWTKTTRELWELCREWESHGLFHYVVPNIIRGIHYFPDPRRRVLTER
ncbi:MAG: winged helix-turn-helix transcriptional regulator [Candidatus Methanomethylophilaceae archaeon]|nr:winged helix-turn-helix transcriptional regulator [Candidatus Methanomethylophilaceae archaeon]